MFDMAPPAAKLRRQAVRCLATSIVPMTRNGLAALSAAASIPMLLGLLQWLRYGAPPAIETPETQARWIARIASETAVQVPPRAKIVSASDGEPRDGTNYYFEWVIFSRTPIQYPDPSAKWESLEDADLEKSVRMIEYGIAPFKIAAPGEARELNWKHRNVIASAVEVQGQRGFYVLLQTWRQD